MPLSPDQMGIVRGSALALAIAGATLAAAWAWLPAQSMGVAPGFDAGERLVYALKTALPVFLWLAIAIRGVSGRRFTSPADIRGSAFAPPSPELKVPVAILQNSLEQTVLFMGAHLILAAVLRDGELVLLPTMVLLYMAGRVCFAVGYARGASGRAFGMALTAGPTIFGLVTAGVLMGLGR
ncbi:MAG TPA: MAPEG family protein [Caulobacter sp.]|nr:MAPEG family protein [Caulobacter sp.]